MPGEVTVLISQLMKAESPDFRLHLLSRTFSTVLLSEDGVLPAHTANLHGSPSMCSVTPNSDVCGKSKEEGTVKATRLFLHVRGHKHSENISHG